MGDINLKVLDSPVPDEKKDTPKALSPMQETNEALKECGVGWFQVRLLCASFMGLSAGMSVTNSIPFIMPSAECDLDMDMFRKGVLSATPFVGTILTTALCGFLTDTFGRKHYLVGCYSLLVLFNIISAFSQTYYVLLVSKFFEGALYGGGSGTTTTFTSEFCHDGNRDRTLLCQSSFISLNQVVSGGLAWAVILLSNWQVKFFSGYIILYSWNFFLLFMTLFAIGATILYSVIPESPKYLVAQGRYDEAREALIFIYRTNTGKPRESFKYVNLWKDKVKKIETEGPKTIKSTLLQKIRIGLHNTKPLFLSPFLRYLVLICSMSFLIMSIYNIVRMWYPQLSTIVEHYITEEKPGFCEKLDAYTRDLKLKSLNATVDTSEVCVPTKSGSETYIGTMILGAACLVPYMLSGLLVKTVGKKWLLVGLSLVMVGVTLAIRWSSSQTEVVSLFATEMAVSQVMLSLLQATNVEVFPTTVRTSAIGLALTCGRVGSLVGNLLFPILLNLGCVVPFFGLAGMMICVTFMTLALPSTNKIAPG